jgi:hypothetical protein
MLENRTHLLLDVHDLQLRGKAVDGAAADLAKQTRLADAVLANCSA